MARKPFAMKAYTNIDRAKDAVDSLKAGRSVTVLTSSDSEAHEMFCYIVARAAAGFLDHYSYNQTKRTITRGDKSITIEVRPNHQGGGVVIELKSWSGLEEFLGASISDVLKEIQEKSTGGVSADTFEVVRNIIEAKALDVSEEIKRLHHAPIGPDDEIRINPSAGDAAQDAYFAFARLDESTTATGRAQAIVDLSNAMSDLKTFLPGFDIETGTIAAEREDES